MGSLKEVETQLMFSEKLGYIDNIDLLFDKLDRISKSLTNLIKSIESQILFITYELQSTNYVLLEFVFFSL